MSLLSAAALVTFVACLGLGLAAVRRRVATAAAEAGPVTAGIRCVACEADAAALTTFVCPGCTRDVRLAGLSAAPRGVAALAAPLWLATGWALIALLIGVMAMGLVHNSLPSETESSQTFHASAWDSRTLSSVAFNVQTRGPKHAPRYGDAVGEIQTPDGRAAVLEIRVPEYRAVVVGTDEVTVVAEGRPYRETVQAWTAAAGLADGSPEARAVAYQAERHVGLPLGLVSALEEPEPFGVLSSSSGSGSSSSGSVAPRATAWGVILASLLWAAGLRLLLRPPRTPRVGAA